MRALGVLTLLCAFAAACGAPIQRSQQGVEVETALVLVADRLVGAEISIGEQPTRIVTKRDLSPYEFGVMGAADRPEESRDRLVLQLPPGLHEVRVALEGRTLFAQEVYLGDGQIREVQL